MTWHQWHQAPPISSRMGLSSCFARANASGPQGYQSTAWETADCRYALAADFRRSATGRLGHFVSTHYRPDRGLGRPSAASMCPARDGPSNPVHVDVGPTGPVGCLLWKAAARCGLTREPGEGQREGAHDHEHQPAEILKHVQ